MISWILLIGLANAILIINPNPAEVNTKINTEQSFNLSLTNTFDFEIKSFEFQNLSGFTFPEITLSANETKNITYNVNVNSFRTESIAVPVIFKYTVPIPQNIQTHNISINQNGYSPNFLTIHTGDTIVWTNKDVLSHTVTSSIFDTTLSPNQTFSYTFNQPTTINYNDLILFWSGTIEVLNRNQPEEVNNPLYNIVWNVNLNTFSEPTAINMNIVDRAFQIEATNNKEGLLSIENSGNEIANKIKIQADSDWIEFDENEFNLNPAEKNFVTFKIIPLILDTNQTNQTYTITITAKGLNTEQLNQTISVFIPYSDVFGDLTTFEGQLALFTKICSDPRSSQTLFCNNTILTGGEGQIIIRDPEIPINLTATQVYALLQRIQSLSDSDQRTKNQLDSVLAILSEDIPELKSLYNESNQREEQRLDDNQTLRITLFIIGIFIILIGGFIFAMKKYAKYRYNKYLMGDIK